jgi:hypothetical protein
LGAGDGLAEHGKPACLGFHGDQAESLKNVVAERLGLGEQVVLLTNTETFRLDTVETSRVGLG